MSNSALDTLERFGTALADPIRRQVLLALLDGPSYPNDLLAVMDTSQPNLSNHLSCLRGCGLVKTEREGRRVRYEIASDRLVHALEDLVGLELEIDLSHVEPGLPS
ncbi:MAG: DNA-binding transcriptional ArsR family regulator [Candidatus Aldehydirespiratoraceae bacterium]|jgi:DNA-binding transcriptional ArsR family regulator